MGGGGHWKRHAPYPTHPQPQAGGGIRAWFWAQPRGPLPRAHLPALRPLPALSLSGSRGRAAPPPAAASGAPRRPEERHGAPAGWGWGRGLGGRTCEWTRATAVQRSGRVGHRRPRHRAQVRARGWRAVAPSPFPGLAHPVPLQDPQIWVSSGQTFLNRGAVLAQKSPLPLPVPSSEPPI